ncbi:Hypothetical_protein [Hexamita inflata]|uniref:Hypothetical_protein n=1 Tax=Hexamita inflata TaxID=28002 RepID=A0AA86TVV3_9EUKA|nr:Hypothetical protein HINF_LOCUS18585 [Hexamita inflata]
MFTLLVPYHTLNVNESRFLQLQLVQKILNLVHLNILDWSRVVIQKYYRINSSYLLGRFLFSKQVQLYFHLQIQGGDLGFSPLYIAEISLSRVNEHEQEETDQRVMTLFPALNLEALRVAADTLVPRFIPAIPKIVTKITSEVNNVSSSAELTQVVQGGYFRVTILEDEV